MSRHVFINANLLDGENPARAATVVVEGERVSAVLDGAQRPEARGDDVLHDLAGATLMPGMVTGHYHPSFHNLGPGPGVPTAETPPAYAAYRALANVQLALRSGFTSVVGAGCAYDIDPSLAKAIEEGLVEGPRVVPCGPDTLGSFDGIMPWWIGIQARTGVDNCDGPHELRKAVRRNAQRGAKLFKMTTSGGHGVLVPSGCRIFSQEEIRAAVEAAHDIGMRVRAHVAGKPFILEAVAAGVDILDHADGMDEECIEAIVKAGCFVLPSLYQPLRLLDMAPMFGFETGETKREFDFMCAMLPKAVAAGVKLCTGDDFGTAVSPHGEYGNELAVYVEHAGIAPLEVIRWATRNGAALSGRPDELGLVAAGRLADLIVVDGDPSRDIRVLADRANIRSVMKGGRFCSV